MKHRLFLDRAGVVHGTSHTDGAANKRGFAIGVGVSTHCGRVFVPGHWKGHKLFKNRSDVVSMRPAIGVFRKLEMNCMACIAIEESP